MKTHTHMNTQTDIIGRGGRSPESRAQYIARLAIWPRASLLKCLRFANITAHRLKDNRELAALLWRTRVRVQN
jgi:hypothetical protein